MSVAAWILVLVSVLLHVAFFALEIALPKLPRVQAMFGVRPESLPVVRPWARNQGFYNLFLAAGPAAGLLLVQTGNEGAGRALVIYACAFMALCGLVLVTTDRRFWLAALVQAVPPLLAIAAVLS